MGMARRTAIAVAVTLVAGSFLVLTPAPAHADRCQPEELIPGFGTSPIDERDTPVCFVMDTWVYPFLCRNATNPNPQNCINNLDPDLNNPPDLTQVTNYRPNVFRVYCNLYVWTWARAGQTATCQF